MRKEKKLIKTLQEIVKRLNFEQSAQQNEVKALVSANKKSVRMEKRLVSELVLAKKQTKEFYDDCSIYM